MLGPGRALGDVGLAMLRQFLGRRRRALDQFDVDAGQLAGEGVGLPDRTGHGDRLMRRQRVLDQRGVDVVPAADDEILGSARDPDVVVVVLAPQVARAQVAPPVQVVVELLVLRLVGIGVADPDAGVGHADLAHVPVRALRRAVAVIGQDAHVRMDEGQPDRADLLLPLDRIDGDEAGRLRQPVALHDRHARRLLEPSVEFDRQGRRAGERHLQGRHVRIHGALHHRGDGGRHGGQERDLPAFDQLPDVVEHALAPVALRRGEDEMRPRRERRHQEHLAGHHVEQRQRAQDHVRRFEEDAVGHPTVVDHPLVAVARDLRHPRRPAGVEERAHAVLLRVLEREGLGLLRRLLGERQDAGVVIDGVLGPDQRNDQLLRARQVAVEIHLHDGLHVRRQLDRAGDLLRHVRLGERPQRDHGLGARLAQDRRDLLGLQQRVDRRGHARHRAADQRDGGLRAVGQHVGDRVVRADAQGPEQVRRLRDAVVELRPRQRLGRGLRIGEELEREGGAVGMRVAGAGQEAVERLRRHGVRPRLRRLDRTHVLVRGESHRILPRFCPRGPSVHAMSARLRINGARAIAAQEGRRVGCIASDGRDRDPLVWGVAG